MNNSLDISLEKSTSRNNWKQLGEYICHCCECFTAFLVPLKELRRQLEMQVLAHLRNQDFIWINGDNNGWPKFWHGSIGRILATEFWPLILKLLRRLTFTFRVGQASASRLNREYYLNMSIWFQSADNIPLAICGSMHFVM
jgi:hypothetical protein